MRWLEALSDFHPGMKIQHQSGKSNIPADLLSRRVDYLGNILLVEPNFLEQIKEE